MAGINLRTFILAIMLGAIMFTAIGLLDFGIAQNYNATMDGNFTETYTALNDTLLTSNSFSREFQNVTEQAEGFSSTGGEAGILKVMSQSVKLPFGQLKTLSTIKNLVGIKLGVPVWVIDAILSMLLIVLTTVFLSILFRTPGGV